MSQHRYHRWFLLTAFGLVGLWSGPVAQGADEPKELEAQRIVLKDKNGKVRLVLGVRDDGNAEVTFQDADGKARMKLGLGEESNPTVVMNDRDGKPRLELSTKADGAATASFRDPKGQKRLRLEANAEGTPDVALADADQKTRVEMTFVENQPLVTVRDATEKVRASLLTRADGRGVVAIKDAKETERVTLGTTTNNRAVLNLLSEEKKLLLAAGAEGKEGSWIVVHDAAGKERAKMLYDSRGFSRFTQFSAEGKVRTNIVESADNARFDLINSKNVPSASLTMGKSDLPFLVLRESSGKARGLFEMTQDGDFLMSLYSAKNEVLYGLGTRKDRVGSTFYDDDGKARLNLGVMDGKMPKLIMFDGKTDTARLALSVLPQNNGTPMMSLLDKTGTDRIGFVMTNDDLPMVGLRDNTGVDRAVIGIRNDGNPIMVLNGRGGNERMAVAVGPDDSSFVRLKNANNQNVFTAP